MSNRVVNDVRIESRTICSDSDTSDMCHMSQVFKQLLDDIIEIKAPFRGKTREWILSSAIH